MKGKANNNTAAGMVRDALSCLVENGWVRDMRYRRDTDEDFVALLDFAENALSYFECHYDFGTESEVK